MGCLPRNKVMPLEDGQLSRAVRLKVKKSKTRKVRGLWNSFTKFFTGLLCVASTNVVVPTMYGNANDDSSSDDDSNTTPPTPCRPGFKEVKLTMAPSQESKEKVAETAIDVSTQTSAPDSPEPPSASVPVAKLTVPITDLPKPTECAITQENKTPGEIIHEFQKEGLVADPAKAPKFKPGIAFEVNFDTSRVRPKTAKGVRVPRPPRRLESLGPKPGMNEQLQGKTADKIEEKQSRAALKRQEIIQTRHKKQKEKKEQHLKAAKSVAFANAEKKRETTIKMAKKAERVKSARAINAMKRQHKAAAKQRHMENVRRRSEPETLDTSEYDRISTYDSSSSSRSPSSHSNENVTSRGASPLLRVRDGLVVGSEEPEQQENRDDFYDTPIGEEHSSLI